MEETWRERRPGGVEVVPRGGVPGAGLVARGGARPRDDQLRGTGVMAAAIPGARVLGAQAGAALVVRGPARAARVRGAGVGAPEEIGSRAAGR